MMESWSRLLERMTDLINELGQKTEPADLQNVTGTVSVGTVTVAEPVSVDDNAASLTVDATTWPLPTGAATSAAQLPDSHNVTIDNAAAGAAVNIQDGGNSITIDGTVTANPATSAGKTITYVSVAQGGAGTTVLAAASVGNKHKVVSAALTLTLAGSVKFNDGTVDLSGAMPVVLSGGFVLPGGNFPYTETAATNRPLNLITTTGAALGMVAILTEP